MLGIAMITILSAAVLYLVFDCVRHARRCTLAVEGYVAELSDEAVLRQGRKGRALYPVYIYHVNGVSYRQRDVNAKAADGKFSLGTRVVIHCDPNRPEFFYVGSLKSDILWACGAGALDAVLLAVYFL